MSTLLDHAADYTFFWWPYGWRGRDANGHRVFCVQTNHYGFAFDVDACTFTHLGPIAQPLPEAEAVAQSNDVIFALPAARLAIKMQVDDNLLWPEHPQTVHSVSVAPAMDQVRVIDSGKFVQHVEMINVRFVDEQGERLDGISASLEFVCWPDRFAVYLHLFANDKDLAIWGGVQITLDLDPRFAQTALLGGAPAARDAQICESPDALCLTTPQGDGIGILNPHTTLLTEWTLDGTQLTINHITRFPSRQYLRAQARNTFTLGIVPAMEPDAYIRQHLATTPLSGDALQASWTDPADGPCPITYDPTVDSYRIDLTGRMPDDSRRERGYRVGPHLDRFDRVRLKVCNPDLQPRTLRLLFNEDESGAGAGVAPMLRDAEGCPTGLPVQISKNWHDWFWLHAYTMLTLPPQSDVTLELAIANHRYGGVPHAAHAQLCLVGWGGNQQWDQAAVGGFGENICYNQDVDQNRSMIDDIRPLLVRQYHDPRALESQWGWTSNVGGGDFLAYWNPAGEQQLLTSVRTSYRCYCPCLTDVVYTGVTADGKIRAHLTASTVRTDDCVRGLYRLRYDVLEETPFSRLAFFQLGADKYNEPNVGMMARGNVEGMLESWEPIAGTLTVQKVMPAEGAHSWLALYREVTNIENHDGAWANRGLIVRAWKAQLGGKDAPVPYAQVFGTNYGSQGANVELTVPPEITTLLPGDYVEAEVEMVILPQYAEDYYGPNAGLRAALAAHPNSWEPVWREAKGNALTIAMQAGTLQHHYPVRIAVDAADTAACTITGGIGYVPMTFVGLSDYRAYVLEWYDGQAWQPIDQQVHGHDYWQTDYDPGTQRWAITYTVPLESLGDTGTPCQLRFAPTGHFAP